MKKLQTSGYNHKMRLEVLQSILNGWEKILKKSETGEKPLHREREFEKEKRQKDKQMKKSTWFRGKDGNTFDSVLMIPATPNSELKQTIEEHAKTAKLKVKVVEKSGAKLGSYLRKYDKTNTKGSCQEKDCMVCQNMTTKSRQCRIPSVVYKISCKECENEGKTANYYGESSFNGYTRGPTYGKI